MGNDCFRFYAQGRASVSEIFFMQRLEVLVLRNGRELKLNLRGRVYKAGDYRLRENPFATQEEKMRLEEWLKIPK